jgi:hypothetical protein
MQQMYAQIVDTYINIFPHIIVHYLHLKVTFSFGRTGLEVFK